MNTPRPGDTITTADQLDALPAHSAVVDAQGDVAVVMGKMLCYPETASQTFARAAKKYGPFRVIHVPGVPAAQPAEDTRPDITEQAARVLDQHSPQTDRSAQDGCLCGSPDTNEGRHQAEALAAAGLLAAAPTTTEQRDKVADAIWNHTVGVAKSVMREVVADAFADAGIEVAP